jgi:hypothetical protein
MTAKEELTAKGFAFPRGVFVRELIGLAFAIVVESLANAFVHLDGVGPTHFLITGCTTTSSEAGQLFGEDPVALEREEERSTFILASGGEAEY